MKKIGRYFIYVSIVIGVFYGFGMIFQELRIYQRHLISTPAEKLSPRYIHLGNQVPITALHPGQFFFTHVDNRRSERCSGHVAYRIISKHSHGEATHTIIWYNFPDTEVSTPAGLFVNDTLLWIPRWMPEGEYNLERLATWLCETDVRIVQTPVGNMNFTVIGPIMTDDYIMRPIN